VIWFRNAIAIVLLALWVPATAHCQMQSVLEWELLSCCTHEEAPSSTAPHQDDCSSDVCAAVESGLYKLRDEPCLLPVPPQVVELVPTAPVEDTLNVLRLSAGTPAPPEVSPSWIFTLRAAPAPRAPSC
jgi:hypothetical protein